MMKLVVFSCLLAACSASAPLLYSAALPYAALPYAAPFLAPYNYRGPLSLTPGQPANILGTDGRPLDTLDVNLDRAAHYTAKAFEPHVLKKRSAPIIATPFFQAYAAPFLAPYNYRGPLSLAPGQPANILGVDGRPLDTLDVNLDRAAHYTAKVFGPHVLKKRSAPIIAAPPLVHTAPLIARASVIARPLSYSTFVAPRLTAISNTAPLIHY